jgi:hypothetical protein
MPTRCLLEFSHDVYERHLSLTLLALQILVSTESRCSSENNDNVETDAHARRLICGDWLGSSSCNLWRWVALLFRVCQKLLGFK